ncbi:hypothetical protein psal_cds_919 [Pandoravirus salinus]|uniref:DUF222 domain-containing protein n=1 Tax=Pandoravirus salinus TaxID=1349410 RepID=S4W381_9VIRU|nr:hypothetical protein psal_cds_919 [Pandoravirus salinus]AGO85042.1 hypothetical protein psal_cds_919 [Pandoravirus salinus]
MADGGTGGTHLVEWIVGLTELCARVGGGVGTRDDIATLSRLLDGASFDALLGDGAAADMDGPAVVGRYARFWAALDRDPEALAAVVREARGWPPSVADAGMAYVRVAETKAVTMMHALARDEAQGTRWLSDATAPERLVVLLGNAVRRAVERAHLSTQGRITPDSGFCAGGCGSTRHATTSGRDDLGPLARHDRGATTGHSMPPSPVVDAHMYTSALLQSPTAYGAYGHNGGPVGATYSVRDHQRNRQHHDRSRDGRSAECAQEGAWWSRVCRMPGQDPHAAQ